MPAEDFLESARSISRSQNPSEITVVMTGGEPLLRHDLPDIGRELRKMGFRWSLVTNGFLLEPRLLNELLNAGLGAVTVSLDGPPDEHNWLRYHPDSYRRAIEAIRLVTRTGRLNADVVTCVNQRNIDKLTEIKAILTDTGIRNWRLFTITPIGRASGMEELSLNQDQYLKLLSFIEKDRKQSTSPISSFSCESYIGHFEGKARDGFFFCRAGIHIGSILSDGSISACPNIDRTLVQGNIYQDDFNKVWNDRFVPFRKREWTKINGCEGCSHYRYCCGSGLHQWNFEEKKLYGCHLSPVSSH